MTLRTRLNKLENALCDPIPKRLADRQWFDAVVKRILKACEMGQNCGLPLMTESEAKLWAKNHIEQSATFGGFGFDLREVGLGELE